MLTEEQQKKIEENRRKALEIRAQKLQATCSSSATNNNEPYGIPKPNNVFPKFNPSCNSFAIGPQGLSASQPSTSSKIHKIDIQTPSLPMLSTKLTVNLNGVCMLISRKRFKVEVGYHKEMIEIFKTIPSRMYDAKEKKWTFAIEDHNLLVKALKPLQPSVMVSPLTRTVVDIFSKATEKVMIPETDLSLLDPKLQEALLPFQREGVYFGLARQGRVLIADDMGLGKTIQAIAVASYYIKEWPLLVVAPSSVKFTWAESFKTWMPSLPQIEVGIMNSGKEDVSEGKVVITSYDLLRRKSADFKKRGFHVAILDESHFLKNHSSARTKAVQDVTKKCKRIILLSGTPALSRPIELYTQICMVRPGLFKRYQDFGLRYCNGRMMPWGWDYTGSSNMHELQLILEDTILIRRLKADVITQLPAKQRQVILLDPSQIKGNKKQLNALSREMGNEKLKTMEKRGVLMKFFQETGAAKLPAISNYITDLLEANHKFLCFAHHQVVMNEVCQLLEGKGVKHIRIDGSTSSEKRKVLCDKFQLEDDYRVAVLSITAANAGISLTAAHLVLFVELFWNPGILTQAEDRAHRIGQQDSVIVQYLVAQGTADDTIWPMVQKKLDILSKAGLSKDNFRNADTLTIQMANPSQSILDSFFDEIMCEDISFDDLDSVNECPAEKRGKFQVC